MRDYTKHALAAIVLALCHCVAPCYAGEQASAPSGAQPAEGSASCMTRVWKALLPIVVANNGYLDASDVERVAKIKLSEPVSVSPSDAISSYESNGRFSLSPNVPGSLALTGKASLSLRLEMHSEPKAGISLYSWQRLQRRINGTKSSNFDLTCLDGGTPLSLREAESDLEAIGLKRAGTLAQPTPVEVFYRDLRGRVDLYYSTPVETIPTVVSIHVAGAEIKKMPTDKKSP
jgi:hypothetical protein